MSDFTSIWYRRIARTFFKFVRVSRKTGNELEFLPMLKGGTITRNNDVRIFEQADIECVGKLDIGADLVRIYMDAVFMGGHVETVPLGTFIPVIPTRSIHSLYSTSTVKMYGRLQELLWDKFSTPVSLAKGANARDEAKKAAEGIGLTVFADPSNYTITNPRSYGIGVEQNNSDTDDTKLGMVNDLLSLPNFAAAKTDTMGNVLMRKYVSPSERPVSWVMQEGEFARFESDMTDENDITNIANHVVAVYKGESETYVGEAWDRDAESRFSTVSRGVTITNSYSYSDIPVGGSAEEKQAYADKRAATLLNTAQSSVRHVTVNGAFYPRTVGDLVTLDFPSGGISGNFEIRTQKLTLSGGCPIETELRQFTR